VNRIVQSLISAFGSALVGSSGLLIVEEIGAQQVVPIYFIALFAAGMAIAVIALTSEVREFFFYREIAFELEEIKQELKEIARENKIDLD